NNLPIAFALDGFSVYGVKEPDGSTMQTLDTCHEHIFNSGVYHYHGTNTYPYVVGAMRGVVTTDPTTAAPENQILPQAFASPLRPATNPLNGASITAYASTGTNAYKLTYKRGTKFGYVEYSFNAANKYTFILTDTAGVAVTTSYQR
ncbi:MAG: phosphatidylethanolamine-binding protein, partial [Pedobacter sp.]|nr:phosphatidylethanolamine-binding protein [Chitinophagaceae bacterium]